MTPALPRAFLERPLAHRGLHDRAKGVIENSRAAAEAAIVGGYGIELDLQLSADGEAMVFHDDELFRLTGAKGPVGARTAGELGALTLTGGGEHPPTLPEFLSLVAGRAPLLVEIKDQSGDMGETNGHLEARAAELLLAYEGPVAVMSFNPHSVARMRDLAPALPRGRTTCGWPAKEWPGLAAERRAALARLDDLETLGCSFISHQRTDLGSDEVARVKAKGLPVLCWTTRSAEQEREARRVADNVTFEGYRA